MPPLPFYLCNNGHRGVWKEERLIPHATKVTLCREMQMQVGILSTGRSHNIEWGQSQRHIPTLWFQVPQKFCPSMDYERSLQTAAIDLLCLIEHKLECSCFSFSFLFCQRNTWHMSFSFVLNSFKLREYACIKMLCILGLNMTEYSLKHVTSVDWLSCR